MQGASELDLPPFNVYILDAYGNLVLGGADAGATALADKAASSPTNTGPASPLVGHAHAHLP